MLLHKSILFRIPAPLVAAGIFFLSAQESVPLPKGIFGIDKVAHLIAYATLALACALWFSRESWTARPFRSAFITFAVSALYGLSDEFHQSFVPGRDMSAWDWLADVVGALVVASVVYGINIAITRKINS
jgi:VanZ family protein